GIAIGWFIAAALLFTDVGGLGGLYARSDVKPQILATLGMSFGTTFGFGYLATAVMLLPTDKDEFDKV
ncbi:MAG: hypothetical protein AAF940_08545, partial [Pseudomonadota bacterium]